MSNIFDYLTWRGDLTFGNVPLSPVDGLIFSVLPYIRLEGIVPGAPGAEPIRLAAAADAYFARPVTEVETGFDDKHHRLLAALRDSARFSSLRLTAAKKLIDRAEGVQFAAITVILPGQALFVAFEGTDNSLVGWREDFRMSYDCPVPAQLHAVRYLREVAAAFPLRKIYLGGHSKGGNLAMFAAIHSPVEVRERIKTVFNCDGPGFCDETLSTPEYEEMRPRIHTYLPESSIVGVLLEHDTNYKIVKSTAAGIMQHDAYSWEISGADFVYTPERTAFGKRTEAILARFVRELSPERKRQFSEALFTILERAELTRLDDLGTGKIKLLRNLYRAYSGLSPDVREILADSLGALTESRRAEKKSFS